MRPSPFSSPPLRPSLYSTAQNGSTSRWTEKLQVLSKETHLICKERRLPFSSIRAQAKPASVQNDGRASRQSNGLSVLSLALVVGLLLRPCGTSIDLPFFPPLSSPQFHPRFYPAVHLDLQGLYCIRSVRIPIKRMKELSQSQSPEPKAVYTTGRRKTSIRYVRYRTKRRNNAPNKQKEPSRERTSKNLFWIAMMMENYCEEPYPTLLSLHSSQLTVH